MKILGYHKSLNFPATLIIAKNGHIILKRN